MLCILPQGSQYSFHFLPCEHFSFEYPSLIRAGQFLFEHIAGDIEVMSLLQDGHLLPPRSIPSVILFFPKF